VARLGEGASRVRRRRDLLDRWRGARGERRCDERRTVARNVALCWYVYLLLCVFVCELRVCIVFVFGFYVLCVVLCVVFCVVCVCVCVGVLCVLCVLCGVCVCVVH